MDTEWEKILDDFRKFVNNYQEDIVAIGGVAVYLHILRILGSEFMESSHDVDFYISLAAFANLRDIEEVVPNRRLGKSQIIHKGVEYDIYAERNNSLAIPYDDIVRHAVLIEGIPCASLEHLLILKCEAALDRQNTTKGDKDFRDIAKIVVSMALQPSPSIVDRLQLYWKPAYETIVTKVNHRVFMQLTGNNAKSASKWSRVYADFTKNMLASMARNNEHHGTQKPSGLEDSRD